MAGCSLCSVVLFLALQQPAATVRGTVWDGETGSPLPGASVVLAELGRRALTDQDGRYLLADIPPGPQRLRVEVLGFAPRTLHAVVPASGELLINIALRPRPIPLPGLEARVAVSLPETYPADTAGGPDRRLSLGAVRGHPMLPEADILQALSGGYVALDPEAPRGIHVRGGASDQTGYLLDGIPVFSPYHTAGLFGAWNPDALASVELHSSTPPLVHPSALSGLVSGSTRSPGPVLRVQGGASTSHARLTLDGPLGQGSGGYLLSGRLGFPGGIAPPDDPTYLRGEAADGLAKLEARALGGSLRLLGYKNSNEIEALGPDTLDPSGPRNELRWASRSLGGEWSRTAEANLLRVRAWSATSESGAAWLDLEEGRLRLDSSREDLGLSAEVEHSRRRSSTVAGLRIERSLTRYRVDRTSGAPSPPGGEAEPIVDLRSLLRMGTLFVQWRGGLAPTVQATLGFDLSAGAGRVRWGPGAEVRWTPSPAWTLSGSYTRRHQFAQSLRNAESVVGNVFPADLFQGAGSDGVPVARSHQTVLELETRPSRAVTLAGQIYLKRSAGLLLVAPVEAGAFAAGAPAVGDGSTGGAAVEGAVSGSRFGILGSYGWQRVRLEHAERSFPPEWGSAHRLEVGGIMNPTAWLSLRMGGTGLFGRRTTAVVGRVEWEACNLLDWGCEFAGSPRSDVESLGDTRLPPYFRVDLRAEAHRHFRLAGRDVRLSVFGSATNVLGRRNLLTYATDPGSGRTVGVEMRPISPLVLGFDWSF